LERSIIPQPEHGRALNRLRASNPLRALSKNRPHDNASAERSTNTSETGKREKLTCALPYSGEHSERIIDDLEKSLAESFGGFTKTAMLGGWIDSTGTLLRERGAVYSVSYVPGKTNRQNAKTLFIAAGWLMGEQWIHIERSYFEAEHESTEID
jgi:hypothetical protein